MAKNLLKEKDHIKSKDIKILTNAKIVKALKELSDLFIPKINQQRKELAQERTETEEQLREMAIKLNE